MFGQYIGQLIAIQLDIDQMHGQSKLIRIQEAIAIHIGQFPNFAEHRIGQLRFDELLFGI